MPDPTPALTAASSTAWDVFLTSGPYWGAVLAAYLLLSTFLSKQHWLAQGRLLSALTGASMLLTAVVQWRFGGAPSAGILTAAMAAFTLVLHPTVASAKPGSGSAAGLAVILLLGATLGSSTACTHEQRVATPHALVDCTLANAAAVGGVVTGMLGDCKMPTGAIDWKCVESKAIPAGVQIGGCAFLEVVNSQPAARVASATGQPPPERPGVAAFESYRASVAGGASFRTSAGVR